MLHFLQLVLERGGFQVLAATSPVEALGIFESAPDSIQLLITDMQMPEMHGTLSATRVRQVRCGVPVLYLSGFTREFPRSGSDLFLAETDFGRPVAGRGPAFTSRGRQPSLQLNQ